MTEYWVSQSKKWCEYCKIFIADNTASIRMHESGLRHKQNVSLKLTTIRKEAKASDIEKKKTLKELEKIEKAAKEQFELDKAEQQTFPPETSTILPSDDSDWTIDPSTGYYISGCSGYYYDPNSGFYYSKSIGKWTTREEAFKSSSVAKKVPIKTTTEVTLKTVGNQQKLSVVSRKADPPGKVRRQETAEGMKALSVPSSLVVKKRKSEDTKGNGRLSKEEIAARNAREAARKRTEEREKKFLGLYQAFS